MPMDVLSVNLLLIFKMIEEVFSNIMEKEIIIILKFIDT